MRIMTERAWLSKISVCVLRKVLRIVAAKAQLGNRVSEEGRITAVSMGIVAYDASPDVNSPVNKLLPGFESVAPVAELFPVSQKCFCAFKLAAAPVARVALTLRIGMDGDSGGAFGLDTGTGTANHGDHRYGEEYCSFRSFFEH